MALAIRNTLCEVMISAFVRKVDHSDELTRLVDDIPTPSSLEDLADFPYQSAAMDALESHLLSCATEWGQPFGFLYEQRGTVVQNLFPIAANATEQISSSSAVDLELHTETAFHSERADWIMLYCVRSDPRAGTVISELGRFLGFLDQSTKDLLKRPLFETSLDISFQNQFGSDKTIDIAILSEDEKSIRFDKALMVGKTPEAQRALLLLTEAINLAKRTITLRTGEALIMNNNQTIHGRTSFKPRFDGRDRWLKRIMIRSTDGPVKTTSFPIVTQPF